MGSEYFKAVRVDGGSFGRPDLIWTVGRIVRLPDDEARGTRLCAAGLLHAATVPTATLVSHTTAPLWPCRLLQVEPRAKLHSDPDHPHKVAASAWKVQAELPAWQVFGPQGRQVAALLERCKALTAGEAEQLEAAWYASWDAARDAAGRAAWGAARDAAGHAAWGAARDAAWGAAWRAARRAAWDAAVALITWDLAAEDGPYTCAQRDLLLQPWRQVIGDPMEEA